MDNYFLLSADTMINTIKPKQLLLGLLMFCQYAFGINGYEQVRKHIKALKSQEYLIGVVIVDMQTTAGYIQGNPPAIEPVSNIVQFIYEQGGPVAQLYYYDLVTAPLPSVHSVRHLVPEHIRDSKRYFTAARWLTCPTNTMVRPLSFMQQHGVTHLLIVGSNHNGAIEHMIQEASFNNIHTLTFSPFIADTTQMQDLIHAKLIHSFDQYRLYTGTKLSCVPNRDDDLQNRTATPQHHVLEHVLKQTTLF